MKINKISPEDKLISLISRVEKVILSTGNNGANYLIVNLVDNSGRIEARLWNCQDIDSQIIKPGCYIELKDAVVNVYRGQLQLKINDYFMLEVQDLESKNLKESDFTISAPINIELIYEKVIKIIEQVKNPIYKNLTLSLIKENEHDFKTFPAAVSIHHNVKGGLLWHSYSLLQAAFNLKEVYHYANVDWELVYCGAILHDFGKIIELNDVQASEYTNVGKLIGHISIGVNLLVKKALELKIDLQDENLIKLQHVIISSHGKNEFGSPIEPLLIEGILISSLDAMDARIYKVNEELNKIDKNNWSPRIISEDNRSFLNHFDKEKE